MLASNVGTTDRVLRVTVGVVLIAIAILNRDLPYAWLGWIGVVPLATGLMGWCGLYRVLGLSTRRH